MRMILISSLMAFIANPKEMIDKGANVLSSGIGVVARALAFPLEGINILDIFHEIL